MIGIEAAPEDGAGKRPSLADRFADMAQAAYVKAGRGSLDLAGLHGTDIKGFVGAPRDAPSEREELVSGGRRGWRGRRPGR